MDPTLKDVLARLDRVSGQVEELRDGVRQAIAIADLDPDMALTRARKVLEFIVRDVFQRRTGEEPGTRPLENLLQRLVKDGRLPKLLAAYANAVRELGNVGTHAYGEKIKKSDVMQSLSQLTVILEWYFEHERPSAKAETAPPPAAAESDPPAPGPGARTAGNRIARRAVWAAGLLSVLALAAAALWFARPLLWPTRAPPQQAGGPAPAGSDAPAKPPGEEGAGGKASPGDGEAADKLMFQTVESRAGRFRVEMSGQPKETIDEAGTDDEQHTFTVSLPGPTVFRLQYADLEAPAAGAEKARMMLKLLRDGMWKDTRFADEKDVTLAEGGVPGLEYTCQRGEGVSVRDRLFLSGRRFFLLRVESARGKDVLFSRDADRFFDSFHVSQGP